MTSPGDDKAAILATVQNFMASLSSRPPPFTEARTYVLPDAWCVLTHPDEQFIGRLSDTVSRIESKVAAALASGAKDFRELLAEPGPEVWVHEDMGAVWAGYRVLLDGKEVVGRGINAFGLHRVEGEWKISGIADTQAKMGEDLPPVKTVAPREAVEHVNKFLLAMTEHDWEGMLECCLPGSGITNSRRSMGLLVSSTWPELIARLRGMMEGTPKGTVYENMYDIEARVCGDFVFLWTPFTIDVGGRTTNRGVNIFTLVKKEGGWVITGCQDTSMPVT